MDRFTAIFIKLKKVQCKSEIRWKRKNRYSYPKLTAVDRCAHYALVRRDFVAKALPALRGNVSRPVLHPSKVTLWVLLRCFVIVHPLFIKHIQSRIKYVCLRCLQCHEIEVSLKTIWSLCMCRTFVLLYMVVLVYYLNASKFWSTTTCSQ